MKQRSEKSLVRPTVGIKPRHHHSKRHLGKIDHPHEFIRRRDRPQLQFPEHFSPFTSQGELDAARAGSRYVCANRRGLSCNGLPIDTKVSFVSRSTPNPYKLGTDNMNVTLSLNFEPEPASTGQVEVPFSLLGGDQRYDS